LTLIIQNTTLVYVQFLFWTLSISGALLFLLLIVSGTLLGWVLRSAHSRRILLKQEVSKAKILANANSQDKSSSSKTGARVS